MTVREENFDTNVEAVIMPKVRDLGGFEVRRILPAVERRMVGPFIFLDQMGPVAFPAGKGIDVRPHPHIGLATVTYLFEGVIVHRDSVGSLQPITPGDVNWMTAGRGIVHSERSDPDRRKLPEKVSGFQIWVALPLEHEEIEPSFAHYKAATIPEVRGGGAIIKIVAGTLFGETSPVKTLSKLFYADAQIEASAILELDASHTERASYIVSGAVEVDGEIYESGRLLVFKPGNVIRIKAANVARISLFGGEKLEGARRIWWNFVSSRPERIEQAKADWLSGKFPTVPGETEFISLPEQ